MIALNSILVATDFSEPSRVALRYGRALAEAFHSTLHVLHVVPDPLALPWAAMDDGAAVTAMQHEWEHDARARMASLVSEEDINRFDVRVITRAGDPVRQIERYAAENNIDLLLLGTHGRGLMAHVLMGSVAERLVRSAPCPVLTVRHHQHEFVCDALVPLHAAAAQGVMAGRH